MFDELPGQTVYGKEIGEADALPSSYAKPGESDSWHVQSELPAGLYPQKTPRSSDNLVDGISSAQTLKMTGTDDLPTDNARVFANMMEHETGSSVKVQPGEYGQENHLPAENTVIRQVRNRLKETGASEDFSFKITNKKFGKKVGKHAQDFGLNPGDPESRTRIEGVINNIVFEPDESPRLGKWRSVGELLPDGNRAEGPAIFFRKGNDVVVTDLNGGFVTILKDGANNKRYLGSAPIF